MGPNKTNVHLIHPCRLQLQRLKGMRFVIVYEWMTELPVKPEVILTYAILVSLNNAKMKTRARDISTFALCTTRSVRRHLQAMEQAGLIVRRPQYRGRRRIANEYDFLWHPAMPEGLKGPRYVPNVTQQADAGDGGAGDTKGVERGASVSQQFNNAEVSAKQAGKSEEPSSDVLPPALRAALERAAPGRVDDCLRVLAEACAELPWERARAVRVSALQKLIARCERSEVANPPGLLRACVVQDALREVDAGEEAAARRTDELARYDDAIVKARSGFQVVRLMREREQALRTNEGLMADGALPCASDPDLAEPLAEVDQLLVRRRQASERNDGVAVTRVDGQILEVERRLDQLLQRRRGQAS